MGGPLLTCAVSGPVPLVCIWEGEGRRCVIGVCLEMKKKKKKIHLYLRMPTVAGYKLLWCGGSLLLPQSCILVFTDRILPCTPPQMVQIHSSPISASQELALPGVPASPRFWFCSYELHRLLLCADLGYCSEVPVLLLGKVHLTA